MNPANPVPRMPVVEISFSTGCTSVKPQYQGARQRSYIPDHVNPGKTRTAMGDTAIPLTHSEIDNPSSPGMSETVSVD